MKVVTADKMAQLESLAYQEGCSAEKFMESAGLGIAQEVQYFCNNHFLEKNILLLCGKGNNGGDTFVAGRYLLEWGYNVLAIQIDPYDSCSELCQKNGKLFQEKGGRVLNELPDTFFPYCIILDGIFGTGFKGEVKEPYASFIQSVNRSDLPILAVDIPSGLNGNTGEAGKYVIQATETLFLGLPKTGFFFEEGWNYVGRLRYIDFGLPLPIIEKVEAEFELILEQQVSELIPDLKRNRYKYQAGHVIGLAGSKMMPGAALLSSLATLRGGCGIARLLFPEGMEAELATSPYELIKVPYSYDEMDEVKTLMEKGNATFVGPGLGLNENVRQLLKGVIPHLTKPSVVDADALTLFAEGVFELPTCGCVLTPHTGEMQKLLNTKKPLVRNKETLQICQRYAEDNNITLILKGAPSFIFHPGQPILVNPSGDPGMATAGSGDVLTGLLASLIAQGLSCRDAATLGVYLHGLSGEYAAADRTSHSMIASDLITHFDDAYKHLLPNW